MQHKFLTLAAAVAAAWVFGLPALAAGGAGVYGTVQGQDAVLYLRSGSADAAYTCMVGNTPVTPAKATPLSGLGHPRPTPSFCWTTLPPSRRASGIPSTIF